MRDSAVTQRVSTLPCLTLGEVSRLHVVFEPAGVDKKLLYAGAWQEGGGREKGKRKMPIKLPK